jgi:hypothetical protein
MAVYISQAAANYAQSDPSNLIGDESPRNPEDVRSETLRHGGQRDHEYPGGESSDEDPEDSIDQSDRLNILTDPLLSVQIQCRKSLASTRLFAPKTQIAGEKVVSRLHRYSCHTHSAQKGALDQAFLYLHPPTRLNIP